jgi:hypothetical protein
MAQIIQNHVYQEPVPEPLEEVKQETLLAIKEAEAQDIAIEEIEARPDVQRQTIPDTLEPEGALVRRPEQGRPDAPRYAVALPQQFLPSLELCELVVLRDPKRNIELLLVVFDQIMLESCCLSLNVKPKVEKLMLIRPGPLVPD